jgi:hypothetical protein
LKNNEDRIKSFIGVVGLRKGLAWEEKWIKEDWNRRLEEGIDRRVNVDVLMKLALIHLD